MTHTHTHTWKTNTLGTCIVICAPTHPRTHTHTHTHTHIDIGIGTMGLPSLQAMGVGGGVFPGFARLLWGAGLESCWGRGGGGQSGMWEGVLFFLSQVVCFMH